MSVKTALRVIEIIEVYARESGRWRFPSWRACCRFPFPAAWR